MNTIVLSLGSNIGKCEENLNRVLEELQSIGCVILQRSSVYLTEPWGNANQPAFYNQVIEVATDFPSDKMMNEILSIEKKMGRERKQKWEPRIIDIDILFFNAEIIEDENLIIPHLHLHERKFVLVPLAEILPQKVHPVFQKKVAELLSFVIDQSSVEKLRTISRE